MKFHLIFWVVVLAIFLLIFLSIPQAVSQAEQDSLLKISIPISDLSKEDIKIIIIETAFRHEIEAQKLLAVAKCESRFRNIQSEIVKNGIREKSYGIFQIHLPSNPEVTKVQALNPYWAAEWSAKEFRENPEKWTCFRNLYGH